MNNKERAKQTRIVQAMFIGFLMFVCLLGSFITVPSGNPNPKPRLENLGKIYSIETSQSNDTIKKQLNHVVKKCLNSTECPDFKDCEKLQNFIQKKYEEKYGVQLNVQSIEVMLR